MVLEQMLNAVVSRTHYTNKDSVIIQELNNALDEFWQRLYQVCPTVKITFDTQGTFAADTQQFDLATAIGDQNGVFYGSKTFYLKGANDEDFTSCVFMDTNDARFQGRLQMDAQLIQPTYASAVNFGEVYFAPTVPSGTLWRADWIGKPPNLSLATECVTSIPEPLHQALVAKATSNIFNIMDDSRDTKWERLAEQAVVSAIRTVKRRQFQTKEGTQGYPGSNSGFGLWPG